MQEKSFSEFLPDCFYIGNILCVFLKPEYVTRQSEYYLEAGTIREEEGTVEL